jgi:hypothetical protein
MHNLKLSGSVTKQTINTLFFPCPFVLPFKIAFCTPTHTAPRPSRYAAGDPVESWLNELLCLDADHKHANGSRLVCGTPAPHDCDLYWIDRDALFSHHGEAIQKDH